MVLGHKFPEWPHAGDDVFRDGISSMPEADLARQGEACADCGIVVGCAGGIVPACFGGALADRRYGGGMYWNADTASGSIPARPDWSAQGER